MLKYYLIFILSMSLLTFLLYVSDKQRAKNNKRRISEKALLLSTILGGSIGGLLGIYLIRHKTKHWYFILITLLSFTIQMGVFVIFL